MCGIRKTNSQIWIISAGFKHEIYNWQYAVNISVYSQSQISATIGASATSVLLDLVEIQDLDGLTAVPQNPERV